MTLRSLLCFSSFLRQYAWIGGALSSLMLRGRENSCSIPGISCSDTGGGDGSGYHHLLKSDFTQEVKQPEGMEVRVVDIGCHATLLYLLCFTSSDVAITVMGIFHLPSTVYSRVRSA